MKDLFYVGQRVRITQDAKIHRGLCGTVLEPRCMWSWQGRLYPGYLVLWDDGDRHWGVEHWMEPVYDGDEKTSWSECAWQPHKEHA